MNKMLHIHEDGLREILEDHLIELANEDVGVSDAIERIVEEIKYITKGKE